jgi:ABC-type glycerol-3-phosphate transport system substrate-binding protein
MKKLITLVMFLLLALGYVACGGGYSSPTAPQQPSNMTPTPGPPPTPY